MVVTQNSIRGNIKPIFVILPLYQDDQRLISQGNRGNIKNLCPQLCLPSLTYNVLENPKAAHLLLLLAFFAGAVERGCVSFLISIYFSTVQQNKEKSSMKHPLNSIENYSDQ